MATIYFYLGLLALIFTVVGYLIHAFYFADTTAENGTWAVDELRRALQEKEKELDDARDEMIKTSSVVRSLEQQIRQRNDEMENLKQLAAQQDEEIKLLQKDAEIIRMAVQGSTKAEMAAERITAAFTAELTETGNMRANAAETPVVQIPPKPEIQPIEALPHSAAIPGWKENLNNILNILDAMEKEVQK